MSISVATFIASHDAWPTAAYCYALDAVCSTAAGANLLRTDPEQLVVRNATLHMITDRGAVVSACYTFITDNDVVKLAGMFTVAEFERRGLGRAVVGHAIAHCWNRGASRITLEVRVRSGVVAIAPDRLYRSCGFVPLGIVEVHRIRNVLADAHLAESAEADGTFQAAPYFLDLLERQVA